MLAVSIFVLWARRKEKEAKPDARTGEVTVAGALLLLLGIAFGAGPALIIKRLLSGTVSSTGDEAAMILALLPCVFFTFTGISAILRWRGWRVWTGLAAWLSIVLIVLAFIQERVQTLVTYGVVFADVGKAVYFASLVLVFVFVLWAKRQKDVVASD